MADSRPGHIGNHRADEPPHLDRQVPEGHGFFARWALARKTSLYLVLFFARLTVPCSQYAHNCPFCSLR